MDSTFTLNSLRQWHLNFPNIKGAAWISWQQQLYQVPKYIKTHLFRNRNHRTYKVKGERRVTLGISMILKSMIKVGCKNLEKL